MSVVKVETCWRMPRAFASFVVRSAASAVRPTAAMRRPGPRPAARTACCAFSTSSVVPGFERTTRTRLPTTRKSASTGSRSVSAPWAGAPRGAPRRRGRARSVPSAGLKRTSSASSACERTPTRCFRSLTRTGAARSVCARSATASASSVVIVGATSSTVGRQPGRAAERGSLHRGEQAVGVDRRPGRRRAARPPSCRSRPGARSPAARVSSRSRSATAVRSRGWTSRTGSTSLSKAKGATSAPRRESTESRPAW